MRKHLATALVVGAAMLLPAFSLAEENNTSSSSSSSSSVSTTSSSSSSVKSGPCANLEGRYKAACLRKAHTATRGQRILSKMKNVLEKVKEKIGGLDETTRRNLRREVETFLKECENTHGEERVACLRKQKGESGMGKVCPADVKQCADGSVASRDPDHDCRFKECKGDTTDACSDDVQKCPDGSYVSRDPKRKCEFKECPRSSSSSSSQHSSKCSRSTAGCLVPVCAAPPPGCRYVDDHTCPVILQDNRCTLSCGKLECEKSSSSASSSSTSKQACRVDGCGLYCVPADQPAMGMPCRATDMNKILCYNGAKCEVQSNGTCGWTMTEDVKECVSKQQK